MNPGVIHTQVRLVALMIALASTPTPAQAPDYRQVDRHALAAPPEVERSVKTLAAYLKNNRSDSAWDPRVHFWTKNTQGEGNTAREIFRWVTDRIKYEYRARGDRSQGKYTPDGYFLYPTMTPVMTLGSRQTTCEGYAILYHSLAQQAGLEAAYCFGPAAQWPALPARNHAWNAIKIGENWRMVDSCWGVGTEGRFDPGWFLTPPEEFLKTHFPQENGIPNWPCYDFLRTYDRHKLEQVKTRFGIK